MRIKGFIQRLTVLILLTGFCLQLKAQSPGDVITPVDNPKGWLIKTKSSVYQLTITATGALKPGYYGSKAQAGLGKKNPAWTETIDEVPVRGGLPFKTPALEVVYADNARDAELEYVSGEVVTVDGRPTLKIVQKDKLYPLQVTSYIRVLAEYDVLEKWISVKNTGAKGTITVENLASGNIVLPADEYTLTHLSGRDLFEFQLQEVPLSPGLKAIQNRGFKSNFNPPWFQVRPQSLAKDAAGPTWFGALHYSGNWQIAFDKAFEGPLQIVGGMYFWDTAWQLKPGTSLESPKLTVGYTDGGAAVATQDMAAYVRNEVLPAAHRNDLRPVIYNTWEATYYSITEQKAMELLKIAKDLGVELFTIDDGWFRGRTDGRSQSGLGNWDVDKNKFPNGLSPVIKATHDAGMKFGLWIEPENVNPNADIVQQHPNWIFQYPGRKGNEFRKILNLANEDVYQHLLKTFITLLQENDIDFIKWDQNNALSEPGWPDAPVAMQREVRIRHIANVYRLVEELRKRFPKVLFESCSSGGGRVDLGMLSRMDQTWLSDNTDPLDRLYIQYGYLKAMPANSMVSWVTSTSRHQPIPVDYRFDVSMTGVLGIGNDISKWTPAEREVAKSKIALYKNIRPVVQQGTLYQLVSPYEHNRCALQYNSTDNKRSVLFCYNLGGYLAGSQFIDRGSKTLKLQGLIPQQKYTVKRAGDDKDKGTVYTGSELMDIGMTWPLKDANKSQVFTIEVL